MQAYYATAARNIFLYHDLTRALRALSDAGVPVIVLKGAALAETIYPNIGHRSMADADILVHPSDRDRARAALEAAGYQFLSKPDERVGPFDMVFTGEEVAFRRNRGPLIELHWELTAARSFRRSIALDTEALWQDAQPLELGGGRVLQLAPHDTLVHLCLHLAVHNYSHLIGYQDIVQLLSHQESFPWSDFVARTSRFRLCTACYFALDTAASVLGAPVPPDVLRALRPPAWQRRLVRHIADPQQGLAGQLVYTRPRSYLIRLAVVDRPIDALRAIWWLFFPGRRWLAERYRLRGRLMPWLACLWHPFVILWQGVLGLWEVARAGVSHRPP